MIVDGHTANGIYFVSFVEHRIAAHLLKLIGEPEWIDVNGTVPDEVNYAHLQPTQAALASGNIYIQGGVHGCGFRWQPNQLIKFTLEDGNSKLIQVEDMAQTVIKWNRKICHKKYF